MLSIDSATATSLEGLMQASPVTGLAVALCQPDAVYTLYAGAFEGAPVTSETVWPVTSLTKPVFAYGVLQLVEAGLIELDRPLAEYLDAPYHAGGEFAAMTARQALCHTTGLPNWRGPDGLSAGSPPGTRFSYSGEGLHYLQIVVERVNQQRLKDILQRNVFQPMGMANSDMRAETSATVSPNLAFLLESHPVSAALSLRTTLEDYARFVAAMWAEDWPETCLGDDSRAQMLTPQVQVGNRPGLYWGLGWGLQGEPETRSFWHWGARGTPRAMCFAAGWPNEASGIVLFTNHADGLWLCRDIIRLLRPADPMPAFDWLLPPQNWRADGSI